MDQKQAERTYRALNVVAKWRKLFAGWQLGTRDDKDPEAAAVREHREATIILRVEVTALTGLLVTKGIITVDELNAAIEKEARQLSEDFSRRFPGVTATDFGLSIEPQKASEWMQGWKP